MSLNLTFHGGLREIGGNKLLLRDGSTKLLLDFGLSFGRKSRYFEEYLQPRSSAGFNDYLELGLIPDLPGLYRRDLLELAGRPHVEPDIAGVLLTHAHLDHAACISFLDERIPVYCSEVTRLIAKVMVEERRTLEHEIYDYKRRPILDWREPPIPREFKPIESGKPFRIDDLEIVGYAVDHSIPGGMAYIIHTPEGAIAYTGDLRFHGPERASTERFVEAAAEAKPAVLLCEGTRIERERSNSEADVQKSCAEVISGAKGLVIADFHYKDLRSKACNLI